MKKGQFIQIINEVISEFDFLGNSAQQKEDENYGLLQNEDFQKQFICDSLINKNKIKKHVTDARVGGNWQNEEDADNLTIEYFVEIEYTYDVNKQPAKFTIQFYSDHIGIGIYTQSDPGSYGNFVAPTYEAGYTDLNWQDIDVTMSTPDGDDVDFLAFQPCTAKDTSIVYQGIY